MIKVGGSSGFNALMAGTRNEEGNYSIAGIDTGFWTSSGQVILFHIVGSFMNNHIFTGLQPMQNEVSL